DRGVGIRRLGRRRAARGGEQDDGEEGLHALLLYEWSGGMRRTPTATRIHATDAMVPPRIAVVIDSAKPWRSVRSGSLIASLRAPVSAVAIRFDATPATTVNTSAQVSARIRDSRCASALRANFAPTIRSGTPIATTIQME